jgi:hypothetical protein
MKKLAVLLIATATLLSGCVAYPYAPGGHGYGHRDYTHRDRDRDGVSNRYDRDRDGDGVPNRYDRRPDNARRY